MTRITRVRPVLLTSPYENPDTNAEALLHLPTGQRTTGLIHLETDDGYDGVGEGYLAVFAPEVFVAIVELVTPTLIGRSVDDPELIADVERLTSYWSRRGAARHVVSAVDIAVWDIRSKKADVPLFELAGRTDRETPRLPLYASGGDALNPDDIDRDLEMCRRLGMDILKVRARADQVNRTRRWVKRAKEEQIRIAIDMTQSLAQPAQGIAEVMDFLRAVFDDGPIDLAFLEDPLGPDDRSGWSRLRELIDVDVAGGEIITTPAELRDNIGASMYDFVQPDATVVGGLSGVLEVAGSITNRECDVVVHAWGGPVGMAANFQAAAAFGGRLAEWPLTNLPLREVMGVNPWAIERGVLALESIPGLGQVLTPDIEREFAYRPEAVYSCKVDRGLLPDDGVWK